MARARDRHNRGVALSYKAAESSRLRKDLRKELGSGDYVGSIDRYALMNVSRRLDQRSTLFGGFIDRYVDLTIGSGLRPVGNNAAADKGVESFLAWSDSSGDGAGPSGGCDARGLLTGHGALQRAALRSMLVDGDVLLPLLSTRKVQLVEADLIYSSKGRTVQQGYADGVKLDPATGAPTAFCVAEYSPSGSSIMPTTREVPAGQAIFLALRKRPSQTRGLPLMSAGLDRLMGVDEFTDNVEAAAKVQAAFAAFIKTTMPAQARDAMTDGTESGGSTEAGATSKVANLTSVEPGSMLYLDPGEEVVGMQAQQPATTFELYIKVILRMIAAGAGLPVEVALVDYSNANFSVSRMALTSAMNTVAPLRHYIRSALCERLYRWHVAYAMLTGELPRELEKAGIYDVKWLAPARAVVDVQKETDAAVTAINQNLSTQRDYVESQGHDLMAVYAQRAFEVRMQKKLGIEPAPAPAAGANQQSGKAQSSNSEGAVAPDGGKGKDSGSGGTGGAPGADKQDSGGGDAGE